MKIIGHDRTLQFLKSGLESHRLSPSLMFVGPEGVGKRSTALELAKCFACEQPPAASQLPRCSDCGPCQRISDGNHMDIFVLDRTTQKTILNEKPEAQNTIKIGSIRHIDKFLKLKPAESRRRVVIIDEAQKMTQEAAHSMLKLLEEPPPQSQIVLCLSDERSLPATIRSRCSVLYFRPVAEGLLTEWLESSFGLPHDEAERVAGRAQGSFHQAISLKDDMSSDASDLSEYNVAEFFELLNKTNFRKEGRKAAELATTQLIEIAERKLRQGDFSQAKNIELILEARRRIDRNVSPKLALETLFLKVQRNSK